MWICCSEWKPWAVAKIFDWNETHPTSPRTVSSGFMTTDWVFSLMWGLSEDDASGCKPLHIPGGLQKVPRRKKSQHGAFYSPPHLTDDYLCLLLYNCERNKRIKCKSWRRKEKKQKRGEREEWCGNRLCGTFIKDGLISIKRCLNVSWLHVKRFRRSSWNVYNS